MTTIPLIIEKIERRGVLLAKAFVRKKLYTFDWNKELPDASQYSRILELVITALKEESKGWRITSTGKPMPIPDSFDYEGVIFLIEVEKKSEI